MTVYACEKVGLDFFDTAPSVHRLERTVAATPAEVFAAFLDAEAWAAWAPPITRVEWTSGLPIETGSTRTVHMRGGLVAHEEFLAYEDGGRMAFRFNEASKQGVHAFAEDYRVTDLGAGRCVVAWTMALDTGRGPSRLDRVVDPMMRLGLRYMLGRFGKLVESRSATTAADR
ncbi:SRPBCC family protein [Nocardioides sambongensis]|uniref:SRPBCC family protein n=1 Tax=Nocardioides sambongensis TaxID=2589074 RepID=UPI0018C879AB|nr:SRPBCC family protein [Nocardioides sambongensis]